MAASPPNFNSESPMSRVAPRTISAVLQQATVALASVASARLDAEVLLAQVLNCDRALLRAWPERELSAAHQAQYAALMQRRVAGEPVAYLIGRREFWSLELCVTPAVLIPRPETELVVEQALQRLPPQVTWRVADLGTGSGAIALALAHERPQLQVVATDISPAALAVAAANAQRLGIANVEFRSGDWCAPLAGERYAMVCANPPYVTAQDTRITTTELRFEPTHALVAGPDGLLALRAIAAAAPHYLIPNGWLILEHGDEQGPAMSALLTALGYVEVACVMDGAGMDRVAIGRWPNTPNKLGIHPATT